MDAPQEPSKPEPPEKKRWFIFSKPEVFQVYCTLGLVLLVLIVGLCLYGVKELDFQLLAKAMLGGLAVTLLAEWLRGWWNESSESSKYFTWRWLAHRAALWLALTLLFYWLLPRLHKILTADGLSSTSLNVTILSIVLTVVVFVVAKSATDAKNEIREEKKNFTDEREKLDTAIKQLKKGFTDEREKLDTAIKQLKKGFTDEREKLDTERRQFGTDRETLKNTMVEVKQSKQIMRLLPYLFEITRAIHDAENDAESQASLAHREDMYRLLRLCLQAREAMQVFPDDSTQTPGSLLNLLRRIEDYRQAPNVQKALDTDFPALRKELQQWAQSWLEELNQLRYQHNQQHQHNQQQTVWSAQIWDAASEAARIVWDL